MLWLAFYFCYYLTLVFVPIIIFVYFSNDDNFHSSGGLLYFIKYIFGRRAVGKFQKKLRESEEFRDVQSTEEPKILDGEQKSDTLWFSASDQKGNQLNVKLTIKPKNIADVIVCLRIGKSYFILPEQKETSTSEHDFWTKSIPKNQWKCHGLNIEILEPFRRCRMTFNGFLMDVASKNQVRPVRFNFIWNCSSKPNMTWLDDDLDMITSCLAKTKWKNGHWLDLLGDEKGYVQFGALKGQVFMYDSPSIELNLPCVRKRYWGTQENEALEKYVTIFAATENGRLFHLGAKQVHHGCNDFKFGHTQLHNAAVYPVQKTDLDLNKLGHCVSDKMTVHVKVNKKIFKLVLSIVKNTAIKFSCDNVRGSKLQNYLGECNINGRKGKFLIDYWCRFSGTGKNRAVIPLVKELTVTEMPQIYVTTIGSDESKILDLTGGKGNSLGLLKSLEDRVKIPDGFIVTTIAYEHQVKNNASLKGALEFLEDVALGKKEGDLDKVCQRTVEIFEMCPILPSISQAIKDELMRFRRTHDENFVPFLSWAVRSSALGEDSEEFSSAGQNETYLCCRMDKEVLNKISRCWGSMYSYQSVVYRRQHGLPIRTNMAVVVQKMIPAQAAGVLFTCHPSDSNPSKMIITSNFGLGETVVSGQTEPDTIILSKNFNGDIAFESSTIGSKTSSILVSRYGVHQNIANDEKSNEMSLTKELAIELGKIGVLIEKAFGGYRDIEWAIYKDELYILQSRPITTSTQWTDYELTHELDFPHVSNDIFYTKANIGEVISCAVSTLTQTSQMEKLEKGYQVRAFGKFDQYAPATIAVSHHHCMIELLAGFYMKPKKDVSLAISMVDLAVFGRPLLNEELNSKAIERYGMYPTLASLIELLFVVKCTFQASATLKKLMSSVKDNAIHISEKDSPSEIYGKIERALGKYAEISESHCIISMVSIVYQTLAMVVMMEGQKEIKVEHYSDLALILSSCDDVISAEVPQRLEKMAKVLKAAGLSEKFSSLEPHQGMKWLEENSQETHELLGEFLNIHGHRCINEMELSSISWASDPSKVIQMIQLNCRLSEKVKNKSPILGNVADGLKTPKKGLTRHILNFLMKKHRTAVGNREKSKSALVKFSDNLRKACRSLARGMVHQGMLPSENLIFHLTFYEISLLIQGKNINLIQKAMRRQRLYPYWNKLRFPEISYGIPEPEVESKAVRRDTKMSCQGTPVCLGDVTSRACVITNLEEIKALEEGDILITKCTDIGWSPYFPIISGIVTELGGLVSHGAVVAREYGLPCLVGVKNATNIFKTGDRVHLSSTEGYIEIVTD